jgi:hypothetical protein
MDIGRSLPNLLVPAVLGGFIIAGFVLFYLMGPIYGWLLLIAIIWGSMLIGRPKILLMVYGVWIIVGYYVQMVFSNVLTTWLDEILATAMLMVLLMHHIHGRIHLPELRIAKRVLVGLLGLVVISMFANQVPKLLAFHFCLQYIRFFLILYYAYYFLSEKDLHTVLKTIVILFLLQVVLNTGWLLGVNPLPTWQFGVDFAIGSGLGANVVAYYCVAMLCILFAYIYYAPTFVKRLLGWVMILVVIYQLYFTFTFHADMIAVVCLGLQLVVSPRPLRKKLEWIWRGALVGLVVLFVYAFLPASGLVKFVFSPAYLTLRWHGLLEGPKGQSYVNNLYYLPKEVPLQPFIGAGPGNAGSMVARLHRRPLADRYFNWVVLSVDERQLSGSGSIINGPMTGVLAIWSELGPLGLLLYFGFHLYAFFRVAKAVRIKAYSDPTQRILAESFLPVMAMIIMLNILTDYLYLVFFTSGLWIWAACVWTPAPAWKTLAVQSGESTDSKNKAGVEGSLREHWRRPPSSSFR